MNPPYLPPLATTPARPRGSLRRAALLLAGTIALCGPVAAQPAPAAAAPGLPEIGELAQLNGEALACQDGAAARRAKALMLAHAPKTARYGSAFDDGTQQAFLAATRPGQVCDAPAQRLARLERLAPRLQVVLPAQPAGQ
ncbi:MAG: hypothetical protein L6Q75_01535 [Burkholderiaceae bacterium]|nr:hypothetical protein [Burkholderiaceae bacterium]